MLQPNTAIADAFVKAKRPTDRERLASLAFEALAQADRVPAKAAAKFFEDVKTEDALLRVLVLDYLEARAADMRGTSLTGGGQNRGEAHSIGAPAGRSEDEGAGHGENAEKAKIALPAPSSPLADRSASIDPAEWGRIGNVIRLQKGETVRDGRGHAGCEPQNIPAPPVTKPSTVNVPTGAKPNPASVPPVVKPNPPSSLAQMARIQPVLAGSLLKTYRIRDGRNLGSVRWDELEVLARENETEAKVLRAIKGLVANPKPYALVEDLISERVLAESLKSINVDLSHAK